MSDVHTPEQRHRNMAAIRSKGTKPEMAVRRLVHAMGYRFRLHRADLPGTPDLVFRSRMKVIFVHGCFWHMHKCRYGKVTPKTNAKFWQKKRESNVVRDTKCSKDLRVAGFKSMIAWECQTRNLKRLGDRIGLFLTPQNEI